MAPEGPSEESRLGFPTWQREGGEEKVAQAKKGALPLEVWWGISHDFHWQLHGFVSCSGFYHRALPPLHVDEGLFCKKKKVSVEERRAEWNRLSPSSAALHRA